MNDPTRAAESEARFEHMLKVGDNELKKAAGSAMEDAMAAMANPEVMAQMTSMIKDPNFQAQLAEMTKDPSFRSYIDAVSLIYREIFLSMRCGMPFAWTVWLMFVLYPFSSSQQMKDMMADPEKKKKLEALNDAVRSAL